MYRILTGTPNEIQRDMNELAEQCYRYVGTVGGCVIMERRIPKPKAPTVQVKQDEQPAMGRL